MKPHYRYHHWIIILSTSLLLWGGCKKDASSESGTSELRVSFRLLHQGEPLTTGTDYINSSGESYQVDVCKFYVSNIRVIGTGGQSASEKESYHLVDHANPESRELKLMLARGTYTQLEFMIGVDSLRNVSGAQTNALDPMLGMFWTWNSGYIFAKLEGRSPVSTAPRQAFTYHIGGFRTGENALRRILLTMPAAKPIQVGKTSLVVIDVDLSKWFDATHTISIAREASVMTPGVAAMKIADNYATMFSLTNVINP